MNQTRWSSPRRHLFGLLLVVVATMGGCTTNPATGQKQLNLLSESHEIDLGRKAGPDFVKQLGGEIRSPQIRQYVSGIGRRLAASSERPHLPWSFTVVDSKVLNAFALPGGRVFISRGLLEKLEDEAMLAGVLGHEIGHTTAQHIGQQMSRQILIQSAVGAVGTAASQGDSEWLAVLGAGANVGGGLYLLKFGRDQEHQADDLGVRYLKKNGYDPTGMVRVLAVLEAEGGGRGSSILSTHPDPAERHDRTAARLGASPEGGIVNREVFQRTVLDELATLPPPKHPKKK